MRKLIHPRKKTPRPMLPAFEDLEVRQLLSLLIDVRLPGGGKSVEVTGPGQVIHMEAWAVITGTDGDGWTDGLQSLNGSFLSGNVGGGAAMGTLSATNVSPFDAAPSDPGASVDLDNDTDNDLGSNTDEFAAGFFVARAGDFQLNGGVVNGGSHSFKIANLDFTVTGLLAGQQTQINFRPRLANSGALWAEDLTVKTPADGVFRAGNPVVLTKAAPEPSAIPQASLGITDVVMAGAPTFNFDVIYNDETAINAATIGDNNIVVTAPDGTTTYNATLLSATPPTDSTSITARYQIAAPNGAWDDTANGTYRIDLQPGTVADTDGNGVPSGTIGTFSVNIQPAAIVGNGTLLINGTDAANRITVTQRRTNLVVNVDGEIKSYRARSVRRITITGLGGDDYIFVSGGIYSSANIDGGDGNDTLVGDYGNDTLLGGAGDDVLTGHGGNDRLVGGAGNDILHGHAGNDWLVSDAGSDVLVGGLGTDTVDYSARTAALTVRLDNRANDGEAGETGNVFNDIERIVGGSGNDLLVGNRRNNVIYGGEGDDSLYGGFGRDRLIPGAGTNIVGRGLPRVD